MDALEQITLTGQLSVRSVRAAFGRPLFVVGLVAFAAPALVALALANFAHPFVSPVMVPVVRGLGGEPALHFPGTLVRLSAMLATLGRVMEWWALPLLVVWAATLTLNAGQGMSVGGALVATLRRAPRWLALGLPLAFVHGTAATMSAAGVAHLATTPVAALLRIVAAGVLEAAVIAFGAGLLAAVVRDDLRLVDFGRALGRTWRWGAVGLPSFGIGMAAMALAGRLAYARATEDLVSRAPDALLFVTWAATLCTAIGIIVFAVASVMLIAALDEGWE